MCRVDEGDPGVPQGQVQRVSQRHRQNRVGPGARRHPPRTVQVRYSTVQVQYSTGTVQKRCSSAVRRLANLLRTPKGADGTSALPLPLRPHLSRFSTSPCTLTCGFGPAPKPTNPTSYSLPL
eukprot:288764-Prorocentrum_minimum.AAC.1